MLRAVVLLCLALGAVGCGGNGLRVGDTTIWAAAQETVLRPEAVLDEAALARGVATGTSTVQGQAFLKTIGGEVKYAAGDVVHLCPTEVWEYLLEVAKLREREQPPYTVVEYDTRAELACRTTKADGDGRFSFPGVAAGEYTIGTWIVWRVATGASTIGWRYGGIGGAWTFVSTGATGGLTTGTVEVADGTVASVIVNEIAVMTK